LLKPNTNITLSDQPIAMRQEKFQRHSDEKLPHWHTQSLSLAKHRSTSKANPTPT